MKKQELQNQLWKVPIGELPYWILERFVEYLDCICDLIRDKSSQVEDFPVYDESYLQECIKKATPRLRESNDRGHQGQGQAELFQAWFSPLNT